jgi:hypothetical protein
MLDPVIRFFQSGFAAIGRGIGIAVAALLWPFVAMSRWYSQRGWMLRGIVGALVLVWLASYLWFFWQSQRWTAFDPDYVAAYDFSKRTVPPGAAIAGSSPALCQTSAIVEVAADLVDFSVNRNAWVPSMLLSKVGFFGIPWKNTPFFDNKAAFQLGVNQVMRRTTTELVDTLGRVRGTSQIDQNLQDARTGLAYDEDAWYVGLRGPTRPAPSRYREAIEKLRAFNASLASCQATFDVRSDNLLNFLDRIASDIGSTTDILRARMEASNAGWLDPRADDRFWFAYGQLYAYYGILSATRSDFSVVAAERNLGTIFNRTLEQLRASLDMQPMMISNGAEASFLMPSHLATLGFYLLRVRSNVVEIRSILDR